VKGNPSLKPAYSQSFNLRYERSTLQLLHYYDYGINLGYNTISNVILANLVHPKDTGTVIQETTYLNAGTVYTISSGYHITLPAQLNGRLKITLNGNLSYAKSLSMTDGIMYPTISRNWTQNFHLLYTIPEILESDISADYGSTLTTYHSGNPPPTLFSSAQWSASNKHFLWRRWILVYSLSQNLTSGRNAGLQSNPALLTVALQRQFLKKNRLTASITADDLLNSAKAQSLAVSPTSAVTTQQVLNGRSFMFRLLWKWGKF
jgi:hypothetical protein